MLRSVNILPKDAAIYIIDPTLMNETQGYILGLLLAHHYDNKTGRQFFTSAGYHELPRIDQAKLHTQFPLTAAMPFNFTWLKLNNASLRIRRSRPNSQDVLYHRDFCFDVLGENNFQNGKFGELQEILGTLKIDSYDKSVKFTRDIVYSINAEAMGKASVIVGHYLQWDYNHNVEKEKSFPAYQSYPMLNVTVPDGMQKPEFMLLQNLLRRAHEFAPSITRLTTYPSDYCYDVYQNLANVGEGAFSSIKAIDMVLQPLADGTMQLKRNKNRLGKRLGLNVGTSHNDVKNESNIYKLLSGSCMKHPIFFSGVGSDSMLVLQRTPGMDMQKFIDADRKSMKANHNPYTFRKRLEIFVACTLAVRRIHYKNIVHRDIKPSNIILDLSTQPIHAKIIDFGLSTTLDKLNRMRVGTPLYAPPEYFEGLKFDAKGDRTDDLSLLRKALTQKSDIYSFACVIAELFCMPENPAQNYREAMIATLLCHFSGLFSGLLQLDANGTRPSAATTEDKIKISKGIYTNESLNINKLLASMTKSEPDERINADDVLQLSEPLLLQRILLEMDDEKTRNNISVAFNAGIALRTKLHPAITLQRLNNSENFQEVNNLFSIYLDSIPDNEFARTTFIERLDVHFLEGTLGKKAIMQKVISATTSFAENTDNLQLMFVKLCELKNVINQADDLWRVTRLHEMIQVQLRLAEVPLTLDDIYLLGNQFGKYYRRFEAELKCATGLWQRFSSIDLPMTDVCTVKSSL